MSGSSMVGLDLSPLSKQSSFIAQVELRETPTRVRDATATLRALLKGRKELYFRDDNDFLLRFLRPTKFYPESAFMLMVRMAKFKSKHRKRLANLVPKDEVRAISQHDILNVLPQRDNRGRKIVVLRLGGMWDPSVLSPEQIFRVMYMMSLVIMLEPETQVKGVIVILDLRGIHAKQLMALTSSHFRALLEFIQKALPLRLKEIHVLNHPPAFNTFSPLLKPFINTKLYQRIFFHGDDLTALHGHVDPSRLPEDFGGTLAKMEFTCQDWLALLLEGEEAIRPNDLNSKHESLETALQCSKLKCLYNFSEFLL